MRPRTSTRIGRCRGLAWVVIGCMGLGGVARAHALEPGTGTATAADPRAADEAYAEAQAAYQRGEMLVAAQALQRAYELDPRPMFLYQRGHALREAGSCRAAIASFEAFVAVATAPEDRQDAEKWIDHCRQVLEAEAEPEPAVEPSPSSSSEPSTSAAPPPRRPDRWGWTGVGVGAGLGALGGALLGSGHAVANGGFATETETAYLDRERRSNALSISGIAIVSVGGAVLVAAGIRLGIVASRRRQQEASSRVAATAGGVIVRF